MIVHCHADVWSRLLQGMLDSPVPFYHQNDLTSIPTTQPAWLQRVAPEARVHQARISHSHDIKTAVLGRSKRPKL
jgi:hypothetical protein